MRQKDLYETAKFQHVDWNPLLLSSKLSYWGDASNLSTIVKDSSNFVTEIKCSLGKGNSMIASAANAFVHKSNGNEYNLSQPSFYNNDTTAQRYFRTNTNPTFRNIITVIQYGTGTETSAPTTNYIVGNAAATTSCFLASQFITTNTGSTFLNGSQTALTGSTTVLPMKTSIINYQRTSNATLRVYWGGMVGSATYNFTGDIFEIIISNTLLSAVEKHLVEGYLAHKYNIQNSLVAGHPYRERPPTC